MKPGCLERFTVVLTILFYLAVSYYIGVHYNPFHLTEENSDFLLGIAGIIGGILLPLWIYILGSLGFYTIRWVITGKDFF